MMLVGRLGAAWVTPLLGDNILVRDCGQMQDALWTNARCKLKFMMLVGQTGPDVAEAPPMVCTMCIYIYIYI